MNRVFRRMNTVTSGGHLLAALASGQILPPQGRFYASQVRRELQWPDPSAMARDEAVQTKLWHDSAELTGLSIDL